MYSGKKNMHDNILCYLGLSILICRFFIHPYFFLISLEAACLVLVEFCMRYLVSAMRRRRNVKYMCDSPSPSSPSSPSSSSFNHTWQLICSEAGLRLRLLLGRTWYLRVKLYFMNPNDVNVV